MFVHIWNTVLLYGVHITDATLNPLKIYRENVKNIFHLD